MKFDAGGTVNRQGPGTCGSLTYSFMKPMRAQASSLNATPPSNRILVIDRDPDLCRLCAEALDSAGFQVDTATDGRAGWRALQTPGLTADSYQLLITSNDLPDQSGLQFLQKVRAAGLAVPAILAMEFVPAGMQAAVAAGAATEDLPWRRSLQIHAILSKPYTVDELVGRVRQVLPLARTGGGL